MECNSGMDMNRLERSRIIRDGVAEEISTWLESLLTRLGRVESELRSQQSVHSMASERLAEFRAKKQDLETVENAIDVILKRHDRADLDMLVHFANELRGELLSLTHDLHEVLKNEGEELN